jgi:hypothetical protein
MDSGFEPGRADSTAFAASVTDGADGTSRTKARRSRRLSITMRQITNLQLLNAALLVILLIGLFAVAHSFNNSELWLLFWILIIPIGGLSGIVYSHYSAKFENNSVWSQPVSARTRRIVTNSVVLVWLCLVGFLVFVMLFVVGERAPPLVRTILILTTIVSLLGAIGVGRYLSKRFSSDSLLGYGISFLGALIIIVIAFVLVR